MVKKKKKSTRVLKLDDPETKIYIGDCREILPKHVGGDKVNLVFADPPYNIGVDYDGWDDALEDEDYWNFTWEWLYHAYNALTEDGSIFTYLPPRLANHVAVHLEDELGMTFINDIVVVQRFGQHLDGKFISGHRRLTYHSKCPDVRIWNMQDIQEPSLRASKYGDPRTQAKKDNQGTRVPLDVWGWDDDDKHFGRVQGNNKERRPLHHNQVPERVLERVIRAASSKDDLVMDPFVGSGTTPTVARSLQRKFVGCEINPTFAKSAMERVKEGPVRVGSPPQTKKKKGAKT